MLSTFQSGRAAADRVFELLDAKADYPEGDDGVVLPVGSIPSVAVRGLNFAYPDDPDTMVLKDVSFELPAGSTMGVFGKTGSGKSTPVRVLSRMYPPERGMVDVDGTTFVAWTSMDGVQVEHGSQRPFLFSDSVRATLR